jgi:hypothetical protein
MHRSTHIPLVPTSTGKGLHSKGGLAKIKPAIEDLMQKFVFAAAAISSMPHRITRENLVAELDPHNAGVLIVYINGGPSPGQEGVVGPEEITRRLEKDNGGCIIM